MTQSFEAMNDWKSMRKESTKEKARDNDFELAVITEFSLDDIFPQYICPSNSLFDVCSVSVVGTTKNPAGIVLIL